MSAGPITGSWVAWHRIESLACPASTRRSNQLEKASTLHSIRPVRNQESSKDQTTQKTLHLPAHPHPSPLDHHQPTPAHQTTPTPSAHQKQARRTPTTTAQPSSKQSTPTTVQGKPTSS
ncbi:hypothetical protein PGT21_024743 [Puccinia graminis f. sp. tritici]|uniref:Uncharacterized protein n=1 Tax=Puccinia graminis f. sp. tritici TaxID=56615 RepID=A0A5B0PYM3_PUCGR|nr:hypothetical protein PGT21_024743 [Puccinia graminis f. sp. tritici]